MFLTVWCQLMLLLILAPEERRTMKRLVCRPKTAEALAQQGRLVLWCFGDRDLWRLAKCRKLARSLAMGSGWSGFRSSDGLTGSNPHA